MKIVHVCLLSFYTDGFTYQDNLLTKYHRRDGNDVTIITSKLCFGNGNSITIDNRDNYVNENGIKVIRLNSKYDKNYNRNSFKSKFNRFYRLFDSINKEKPDIIFIHGVSFIDIKSIVKYLKTNPNVKVFVDNHSDYSNSATNFISKFVLHRIIWRHYAKMIEPYTLKFYGVLPARVDFLIDNYGLPKNKCELLIMGADDDFVFETSNTQMINSLKKKLNILPKDFVIVTGGKIDFAKKQTLILMKAIKELNNCNFNIKLLIFGSIDSNISEKFNNLCDNNIIYLGWANQVDSYRYFSIADLVCFPGRHSVYWEQVVSIGKPMLCKYWEGTTHVNIGGNIEYLYNDSIDEIKEKIAFIISDKNKYKNMLSAANKVEKNDFLYSRIAKKSIE